MTCANQFHGQFKYMVGHKWTWQ